jgi:hypothetical protein
VLCDCPTARATSGGGAAGHMAVFCNVKGCQSVWYRPRHEPQALPVSGQSPAPAISAPSKMNAR